MPALVLLNGPPASGKSTLADRLVQIRPLALNLDIDVVRHQLGGWSGQPDEAGLAARELATAMARVHLRGGRDVVIPQYLGRVAFIERLEGLARSVDVPFYEVLLHLPRDQALEAFERRRAESLDPIHTDAAVLVERSPAEDPIADLYDRLQELAAIRPPACTVPVVRGDIDGTARDLVAALRTVGLDW